MGDSIQSLVSILNKKDMDDTELDTFTAIVIRHRDLIKEVSDSKKSMPKGLREKKHPLLQKIISTGLSANKSFKSKV